MGHNENCTKPKYKTVTKCITNCDGTTQRYTVKEEIVQTPRPFDTTTFGEGISSKPYNRATTTFKPIKIDSEKMSLFLNIIFPAGSVLKIMSNNRYYVVTKVNFNTSIKYEHIVKRLCGCHLDNHDTNKVSEDDLVFLTGRTNEKCSKCLA